MRRPIPVKALVVVRPGWLTPARVGVLKAGRRQDRLVVPVRGSGAGRLFRRIHHILLTTAVAGPRGYCAAALAWLKALPEGTGKAGIIGTCSGGRHALLAASQVPDFDAVADLWGGGVLMTDEELSPARPVPPVNYIPQLAAPLLGLFGNDDSHPSPQEVDRLGAALKRHGKAHEFHRYEGAGHAFFYYHTQCTGLRPRWTAGTRCCASSGAIWADGVRRHVGLSALPDRRRADPTLIRLVRTASGVADLGDGGGFASCDCAASHAGSTGGGN